MNAEQLARLAHAVSVLLAERNAVTRGTQRVLRPLADKAAWEAESLLEEDGLLEWPRWENVGGDYAEWRLTGWTTDKNHPET